MTIPKRTGKSSGYFSSWSAGGLKPHVFALLLAIMAVFSCSSPTQAPGDGGGEEYRIYNVVLGEDLAGA